MAEDLIRYDILAQEALRGVVRKVLTEVARTGLPGGRGVQAPGQPRPVNSSGVV